LLLTKELAKFGLDMVGKDSIILEVSKSDDYKRMCSRICGGNPLHRDLFQELIIMLYSITNEKLIELHKQDQLKFYISRLIKNQWTNKYSIFSRKYRQFAFDEVIEHDICIEQEEEGNIFSIVESELNRESFQNKEDWYNNKITSAYLAEGSIRNLSAKTGISRASISESIKTFKSNVLRKEKQYNDFMGNQHTVIQLDNDPKRIIFEAAQKLNKEPSKYIEEILVEASKKDIGKTK